MESLLRLPEVMRRTGMCRAKIYKLCKVSGFPKPLRLHGRSSAWVESEVQEWIANIIAEARKAS